MQNKKTQFQKNKCEKKQNTESTVFRFVFANNRVCSDYVEEVMSNITNHKYQIPQNDHAHAFGNLFVHNDICYDSINDAIRRMACVCPPNFGKCTCDNSMVADILRDVGNPKLPLNAPILKDLAQLYKKICVINGIDSSHDYWHVLRVCHLSLQLYRQTTKNGYNKDLGLLIATCALLHDFKDRKVVATEDHARIDAELDTLGNKYNLGFKLSALVTPLLNVLPWSARKDIPVGSMSVKLSDDIIVLLAKKLGIRKNTLQRWIILVIQYVADADMLDALIWPMRVIEVSKNKCDMQVDEVLHNIKTIYQGKRIVEMDLSAYAGGLAQMCFLQIQPLARAW
jgi:hypothetical protein